MPKQPPPAQSEFSGLVRHIIDGNREQVGRMLAAHPELAVARARAGASRQGGGEFFFERIGHYLYAGDTALHMAAAAFQRPMAELLFERGADARARNRRGAEPLHYAADTGHRNASAQSETIRYLVAAGADPRAVDRDGTAPLHRAVRTRSAAAVRALLDAGAQSRQPNGRGSTPLHLAVRNTGRGGSGSEHAHAQQAEIIALLLEHGARPTDPDGRGRTVWQAASNERLRALLARVS